MQYYSLKSIVGATKQSFTMTKSSETFCLPSKREKPYIQPNFVKILFAVERPSVILISAVGATGKSALAQVLSNDTGLPLLDLSKHKPVGDNSLTGLLTSSYKTEDLSQIFLGLAKGSFGVIIDGIDEGRAKTTEKAFDAFLDNIAQLCSASSNTTFILLGRTKIIEDCWLYLEDKGVSSGLVTISPFDIKSARSYIDTYTDIRDTKFQSQYEEARNSILELLSKAFTDNASKINNDFLTFIGYPPVLDAIVTLLKDESNYHKLITQLLTSGTSDIEIALLLKISNYILQREKEQKVQEFILKPLVIDLPENISTPILQNAFEAEEQCVRLVAYCLSKKLDLQKITERHLNDKYEEQLTSFLPEHPFLNGQAFRNVVFESVALAILMNSQDLNCKQLVLEYFKSRKHSYHLVYLLHAIIQDMPVSIEYLHILLDSALEFSSTNTKVELNIEGPEPDESLPGNIEIEIDILQGEKGDKNISKTFSFKSILPNEFTVYLGNRLSNAYISLPTNILLSSTQGIELEAPIEIIADHITFNSKTLVIKHAPHSDGTNNIIIQANSVDTTLESVSTNKIPFNILLSEYNGLTYPIIQYIEQRSPITSDNIIYEKYIRIRRILMQFRSHSKGALARYKPKIDNERVLRNDTGRAILQRLLDDRIITMSGNFYYLQPEGINRYLGISWIDLRTGRSTEKTIQYLQSI